MQGVAWTRVFGIGLLGVISSGACVSLDNYRRVEAANRQVIADKEKLSQDLFDERNVNDTLRSRVKSIEGELTTKDQLIANYRQQNELMENVTNAAAKGLSEMAGRPLGAITIEGPKLPAPLDSALKRFAGEHPAEIEYDAARGSIKWKADLIFPLGSDEVKGTSIETLKSFSEILKSQAAADFEVVVVGHTDNRPISRPETKANHPTNWHLSAHRAIEVSGYLQKFGYSASRVSVMGCSEFRPVADNGSESGNAQNRRVEIYLVPVGSIVYSSSSASTDARKVDERDARQVNFSTP
ncbi:MAG: OmpA family protein [Planctomycetota bacterium]